MASENESIESILAEMRHGLDQSWHDIDREWARELPDRIEAAWKREKAELVYAYDPTKAGNGRLPDGSAYALKSMREPVTEHPPVGNAAAMRGALLEIETVAGEAVENGTMELPQYSKIVDIAESALAAPASNCDLKECSTEEGVISAHYEFCGSWHERGKTCAKCPHKPRSPMMKCREKWLLAPAEKGGAE